MGNIKFFGYDDKEWGQVLRVIFFCVVFLVPFAAKSDTTVDISYNSTIYYNDYALPVTVNISGTGDYLNGVFSATPADLTVNSVTGEIAAKTSAPGIYKVFYTAPGGVEDFTVVEIKEAYVCNAAGEFEIWNWDDMSRVMYMQDTYDVTIFKLMQNLGIPGVDSTYGNGNGLSFSSEAVRNTHKGDKRFGWYGYKGFVMLDDYDVTTLYNEADAGYETLVEARNLLVKTAYEAGGWTADAYCGWNAGGWIPVGAYGLVSDFFSKTFEGNGNAVSGLVINRAGTSYQGLFGGIFGATIKNLGVNVESISANESVGGIAGYTMSSANITNCYVAGPVYGYRYAGGIAGNVVGTTISGCYTNCEISGNESLGGIAGMLTTSSVLNCYSTGSVTANSSSAGGIIGQIRSSGSSKINIMDSYAVGAIKGVTYVGGIIGAINTTSNSVEIKNCYALNPHVTYLNGAITDGYGRIVGRNVNTSLILGGNYALESMELIYLYGATPYPATVSCTNDADIRGKDLSECKITSQDSYPQEWFNGSGAWAFDYAYNSGNYKVTQNTNLPVLKIFKKNDFDDALQIPYINAKSLSTVSNIITRDTTVCNDNVDLTLLVSSTGVTNPVYTWYATVDTVNPLASTTVNPLLTTQYYVSVKGDEFCEGENNATGRKPVTVTVNSYLPENYITLSNDTSICPGESVTLTATAAQLLNPSYEWYDSDGNVRLTGTDNTYEYNSTILSQPITNFYVIVKGSGNGYCADTTFAKHVSVSIKSVFDSDMLTVSGKDTICAGDSTLFTASASGVENPVYKWYGAATGGTAIHTGASFNTGEIHSNTTFYVTVSGDNLCESSPVKEYRDSVTVFVKCSFVRGTIFPFATSSLEGLSELLAPTVSLHNMPEFCERCDPIDELLGDSAPIKTVKAVRYTSAHYVPGTPLNPATNGIYGAKNSPGYPIRGWSDNEDGFETVPEGGVPTIPVGYYSLDDVTPGTYVLSINRPGYLPRFAEVTVVAGGLYMKHRELIAGDINGDLSVSGWDISILNAISRNDCMYGLTDCYEPKYDLNGSAEIEANDISLLKIFIGLDIFNYKDTYELIMNNQFK